METNAERTVDLTGDKRHELVIDWSAVENDPQARQRLHNILEVAISIGRRQGLMSHGSTLKQEREAKRKDNNSSRNGNVEELEVCQPAQREIRVRLHKDKWEQIRKEARRSRTSPNALIRKWILEGLSRCT